MQTGMFSAADLVKCYAPPNPGQVMQGNRVMLRSGGPEMTAMDVRGDDVLCMYRDGRRIVRHWFDRRTLTCYGAR